jgi:hypothetical protein
LTFNEVYAAIEQGKLNEPHERSDRKKEIGAAVTISSAEANAEKETPPDTAQSGQRA